MTANKRYEGRRREMYIKNKPNNQKCKLFKIIIADKEHTVRYRKYWATWCLVLVHPAVAR